jgi:hypothetical protein
VDEMIRALVALMNEWIMALEAFHVAIVLRQEREVGIVQPQIRAVRAHVRDELPWTATVQIAHRRREHDDVTWAEPIGQKELARGRHGQDWGM